ncbi:uncharacterized protein LOC107882848 [Acyrthosiphon pisum]|uniref:Uncharacterized protein n=1 Tax=Acyrthosiphon pisum TaxID=7029 RepID=A0A8R2JLM7_ACYPI|nr:uncharacterized protein LOC107882848 [Acyrthosiphon pisum]
MNSTRVLSIPLIRCDYQVFKYNGIKKRENIDNKVFNGMIKEEIIDEADHHNEYRQTIQKGVKCEFDEEINTIDTVIKNEMDLNDGSVFKGSFNNEWHSSELISQINSDKTAHFNSKALLKRNSKTPTRKRRKRLILIIQFLFNF